MKSFMAPVAAVAFSLPGPSRAEPFTTIINAPPTVLADNSSIGSFTQLNVGDGGTVGDSFRAGAADGSGECVEVNISGGTVGLNFVAYAGTRVNVSGGTVEDFTVAAGGSVVRVTGGSVGQRLTAERGSEVHIFGGTIDEQLTSNPGSVMTIDGGSVAEGLNVFGDVTVSGGAVGAEVEVFPGGVLTISGGSIGPAFTAYGPDVGGDVASTVELSVVGLTIDGTPVDLEPGVPTPITQRGGARLEASLFDGSTVGFTLNGTFTPGQDFFDPAATLTATLSLSSAIVPEPSSLAMAGLGLAAGLFVAASRRRSARRAWGRG